MRFMKSIAAFACCAALAFAPTARAGELAGVTLPDSVELAGKTLKLNGMGLREATMLKVDVYVAGLYVESTSSDANTLTEKTHPYQLDLRFVRDVGRDSMTEAWANGFKKNVTGYGAMSSSIERLNSMMTDVEDGDLMRFQFVPGTGLTVSINDSDKGTIEGDAFGMGMLKIWLGKKPPNGGLKKGLLGK